MKNTIIGVVVVAAVLGALAFFGASPFLKSVQYLVGSASGTTFNSAKVAEVIMAPSTRAATSTSILNNDGSARWITDAFVYCSGDTTSYTDVTGAGLAALTLKAATTSVTNQGLQGSTAYSVNMTLSTSTTFISNASSTPGTYAGNWPSGSYLTFLFNATTTASAACAVGVHYLGS